MFHTNLIFVQLIGNIILRIVNYRTSDGIVLVLRSLIFAHYLLHKELCKMRHILHVKIYGKTNLKQ